MRHQPHAKERDVAAAQHEYNGASDEDREGQGEEQAAIALDCDAKHREMAHDGADHHAEREHGADRDCRGYEQQNCCDQFDDPGSKRPQGSAPSVEKM